MGKYKAPEADPKAEAKADAAIESELTNHADQAREHLEGSLRRKNVVIRFVEKYRGYNGGETAGFKPSVARDIIKSGRGILESEALDLEAEAANEKALSVAEKKSKGRGKK